MERDIYQDMAEDIVRTMDATPPVDPHLEKKRRFDGKRTNKYRRNDRRRARAAKTAWLDSAL